MQSKEEVLKLMKEELSLNVVRYEEYTGGFGGNLYETRHKIQLLLGEDVVSEVDLYGGGGAYE